MRTRFPISTLSKLLSYLFPQRIAHEQGQVGAHIEVVVNNGKLMLNADQSNYSFGGLHLIFEQLFNQVEVGKYPIKKVLLLGLGAGSVVELLIDKHALKCDIIGVELDKVVIDFSKKYFGIEDYNRLKIVQADAFEFAEQCTEKFDLIVIDLFIGDTVPVVFETAAFINNLKKLSNKKCFIAFNKMTDKQKHKEEFILLSEKFDEVFKGWELRKIYAYGYENSLLCYNGFIG